MLRLGGGAAVLGFAYGFFYEALMGGFFIWFLVYIVGCVAGKILHKLANYKLGKAVIATIACGIVAGALLSPARDSMLGRPTKSMFMGLSIDEEDLKANAPVIAKKRFPEFEQKFKESSANEAFRVKVPFEEDGTFEHLWVRVKSIDGNKISGEVQGVSSKLAKLKTGSEVTVTTDQLEDWQYTRDGESIGNFGMELTERLKQNGEVSWMGAGWVWINIAILIAGAISPVLAIRVRN